MVRASVPATACCRAAARTSWFRGPVISTNWPIWNIGFSGASFCAYQMPRWAGVRSSRGEAVRAGEFGESWDMFLLGISGPAGTSGAWQSPAARRGSRGQRLVRQGRLLELAELEGAGAAQVHQWAIHYGTVDDAAVQDSAGEYVAQQR